MRVTNAANATKFFDQTRSPLESYQKTMKELNSALSSGALDHRK